MSTQSIELHPQTRSSHERTANDSASVASGEEIETARRLHHQTSVDQDQRAALQRHGTDIFTRFLHRWQDDRKLDGLERCLQSCSVSDAASLRLLHAYTRLKAQPSGLLFNSLLVFRVCNSTNASLPSYRYFKIDEGTQFTSCLDILKNELHAPPSTTLQIWYAVCSSCSHDLKLIQGTAVS